jgi:hypothetical protein
MYYRALHICLTNPSHWYYMFKFAWSGDVRINQDLGEIGWTTQSPFLSICTGISWCELHLATSSASTITTATNTFTVPINCLSVIYRQNTCNCWVQNWLWWGNSYCPFITRHKGCNLIAEDQNFGLVTQGTGNSQLMCNIDLRNLENLACMENITEIGLPKIRLECVDWIMLA